MVLNGASVQAFKVRSLSRNNLEQILLATAAIWRDKLMIPYVAYFDGLRQRKWKLIRQPAGSSEEEEEQKQGNNISYISRMDLFFEYICQALNYTS